MNTAENFRNAAEEYRKMADVLEEFADLQEDESLDAKEQEEKMEQIIGKMMLQAMKLQNIKL